MKTTAIPIIRKGNGIMRNYKKVLAVLLFLALISPPALAEIIPADRRTDWTPGLTVGVPGGIPDRKDIGVTVDAAKYGTGSVDASESLGAAIDACPPGKVVFIPAGTYRLDKRVYRVPKGNITIRGAGMGNTILKANSKAQVLLLGTSDWPQPKAGIAIMGGAAKGSTVLKVADASTIAVGNLVKVVQDNAPYVIVGAQPAADTKVMSAMFRVAARTATTVTVTPPLPIDFTLSPVLVPYKIPPLVNTGVEDLTIDCNSMSGFGITFEQSWGCWIKNVEITKSTSRQMFLVGAARILGD